MFRQHSDGEHPEPELLERFMLSRVDSEERRYIVRHLIRGCPRCLEVTRQLWALGEEPADDSLEDIAGPRRLSLPTEEAAPGPDMPAMTRADLKDLVFEEEDPAEAADMASRLYAELEATPRARRLVRVRSEERFRAPALCAHLIAESREAAPASPGLGAELGELAIHVAEQLDPRRHGEPAVHSARIRSWAWYGDARRRAGDREGAASCLAMADHLVRKEPGDPREGADVLRLQAALQADLGERQEAERLLDQALGVYVSSRDSPRQAAALIQKADLWREAGQTGPAIGLLMEAADLLDPEEAHGELTAALDTLLSLLIETGRGEEALVMARRLRSIHEEMGDRAGLARLRRREGLAAQLAGRLEEAETAFREADRACLTENLGIEAALAFFDLGLLYLRLGRLEDFQALGPEIKPHLQARGIGTGETAALVMLQQHCERALPRPELLAQLQIYIKSALRPRPVARISQGKTGTASGHPGGGRAAAG